MTRALSLALVLAAVAAGPASAATVERTPDAITFTADGDDVAGDAVSVSTDGGDIVISNVRGITSVSCDLVDETTVSCDAAPLIDATFGPFADEWRAAGVTAAQVVRGGDGDDTFKPGDPGGGDVFHGGNGLDEADYSVYPVAVTVTVGAGADDGAAGEGDDIRADVERIWGSIFGDHLTGGDHLLAGPGDDVLNTVGGGPDVADCGAGAADTATVDPEDDVLLCETIAKPDADGDGSPDDVDCDDANAAIRPGATDVPGNGIDEDCSGSDAIPPVIDASVSAKVKRGRFRRITVRGPAGATVAIRCRGRRKRCPKGTRTLTIGSSGSVRVPKRFRSRRIRRGARIQITVTAPGTRGLRFTYRLRPPKQPKRTTTVL